LSKIFAYAEVLGWGKAHDKKGNSVIKKRIRRPQMNPSIHQRELVQLLLKFSQIGL